MDELKIYTKAFNQGYALQKEKPDLAATLIEGFQDKSHEYAEGFVAGVEKCQMEKEKQLDMFLKQQKEIQRNKQKTSEKEINKEM